MLKQVIAPLMAAMALTALPAATLAQEPMDEEACIAAGACRLVENLRIEGPDGQVTDIPLGLTIPWLTQGNIMLTPGEAVIVSLKKIEGIVVPTLVSTGDAARDSELAEGQVRLDLGGYERGRLVLSVLSQYPENLDYGALKVTIGSGPERTSVCTLMPGISVFETWEEPIYQMALFGFVEAGEPGCKVIDTGGELASD